MGLVDIEAQPRAIERCEPVIGEAGRGIGFIFQRALLERGAGGYEQQQEAEHRGQQSR